MRKICALPGCGREFETHKLNRVYCCSECAAISKQMKKDEYRKYSWIPHRKIERTKKQMREFEEKKKLEEAIEEARRQKQRRSGLLISHTRMEARDEINL